jgi:formyl-CoA transferase
MFACYGILGALYDRERSGRGRRVDVNMLEAGIAFIPDPFANYTRAGIVSDRLTRVAASQSFAFRCGDGKLLSVHLSSQPKFFEAMAAALERPDLVRDERFATRELRIANYGELTGVLAEIVATKPLAHWINVLEQNDAVRAGTEPARRARRSAGAPSRYLLPATPSDRRRDHGHSSPGADRRRP